MMEMAIAGTLICCTIFGVIEFGRLLLIQNGLADAVRRGARYAAMNSQSVTNVKNVTVFGVTNPSAGARPLVDGLTTSNVSVTYSGDFGIHQGTATVQIAGYAFSFIVPLIGATINLGEYKTTLTGEAAGNIPPTI
jgi:Flp pilus assembly protein TadG